MNLPGDSRRSSEYLGLLTEVMGEFAAAHDLGELAVGVLQRVAEVMRAESASLFLLEGELADPRARLVCRASVGPSDITGHALPAQAGIIGRALATDTAQLVADAQTDPDFFPPADRDYVVRTLLCAPLSLRGQPIGAIEVINRRDGAPGFDRQDAEMLEALAAAAALAVSNAQLTGRLVDEARMRRELELAAGVQRALLPKGSAADAAIHGLSRPARGVSGDFYDILPLPGGRTAFALADVSGKGMNAALIMVKAATLFRSFGKRITDPGRLLARIERELCETMSYGMFVTMVVGVHDPRRHEVRFSNAGHEPPLLRDSHGGFQAFPAADPPLGIHGENNRYRETVLQLGGGSLYLFTDGVTEGRLADGTAPGAEGIQRLIGAHAGAPPAARLVAIAAHFGDELRDDLTLLVIDDGAGRTVERRRRSRRRRAAAMLVIQSIPAQADQMKIVRRLVEAAAQQCGASREWARDLMLAVDEAFQNVIRHAYRDQRDGRIELSIRRGSDCVAVELVDFAPPVKEDECRGRSLEELRPGGLGTHFMHALTDSVRFMRPPAGAGNRLVLTKKLPSVDKK
ncbi:MAG TPA: SpoIIE family protein phosphatase [Solimonas sp.]|nr:SpoIIE family protein phosphatase [Solimonas sp.]